VTAQPSTSARARRRRWLRIASALTLLVLAAVGAVLRSQWLARRVAVEVSQQVRVATGLEVRYGAVSFSLRTFGVRVERIDLWRPGRARLAHIDAVEAQVAPSALLDGRVTLSQLTVDGGEVDLEFAEVGGHVGLVNGPVAPPATTPAAAPTEPPYRDIAVSDLRVRVRHPQVQLNLGPLDVDVVNARDGRILVGLLVPRGDIRSIYYTGPLRRLETRLAVTSATGAVRVAFAQLVTPRSSVVLRDARYDPVAEEISLGARVELQAEDVTGGLRKHLSVPYFEGHVGVDAEARVRLAPFDFSARGEVTASGLGLRAPDSQTHEVLRYNVADSARMRVEADPHRIVVTDLHAAYAGAVLRSERVVVGLDHVPEAPRLGSLAAKPGRAGGPGVAGALRIEGLDFTRLMHDVTITPGTIVQWQLGGEVRVQGSFDPLRLTIDLPELESRDFAILAKPFTHLPQEPLLRIPRARLSGRMEVDDVSVSWNDVRLAFGQSTARVDRVRVRTSHDRTGRERDLRVQGLVIDRLHLADFGTVADLPIAGEATATVNVDDDSDDPLVTGTATIQGFNLATFPFGDIREFRWRFRGMRVDAAAGTEIHGRHRDSSYTLRNPYLDFSRYTMMAGAHVLAERAVLSDVLHMFHFENDPVFTPYTGTGDVDAQVDFVLGRPGDDREGVMTVDARLRNAVFTAFDEHMRDGEAHLQYDWRIRRLGIRGARASVEGFHACKGGTARRDAAGQFLGCDGGGALYGAGHVDLGGQMHFVASGRDIPLSSVDMLRGAPVSGTLSSSVTLAGEPDALRFTVDNTFHGLTVLNRAIGGLRMHLSQTPEDDRPRREGERPPVSRADVEMVALDNRLRAQGTVRIPWRDTRWRDALGVDHVSHDRDWGRALASGVLEATEPVDVLPWLPPALLARLGDEPEARTRFRVQIDRARLGDLTHAEGSARIDQLALRAGGIPAGLSPGAALGLCFRGGAAWVVPTRALAAGWEGAVPCGEVPAALGGAAGRSLASASGPTFDPASPLLLGPEGVRLWLAGGVRMTPRADGTTSMRYDVTTRGELDLARVATRIPSLTWGRGTGLLQVRATGDTERIDLAGSVLLEDGAVGVRGFDTPVTDIDLDVQLAGNAAVLRRARLQYGSASVDLSRGEVRFAGPRMERADVPIVVRGFSLAPVDGAEVGVDADARMVWEPGGELPILRGDVNITRARYTRPMSISMDLSGRLSGTRTEAPPAPYDPANDHVRLDLTVRTSAPMRVTNNLADVDLRIARDRPFRVVGTDQRTGVVGTIELPRGNLRLYDTDFELRSGRIDFDNLERIAPTFDLAAQTEIRRTGDSTRSQWRVRLHAYGDPERFTFDMNAEPALSREDIVLLLLFRLTRAELERIGGANAGQAVGIEFLALTTGIDRAVRAAIPVIDDFRLGSAYNPRTNRTEPLVSAGRSVVHWFRLGGGFTLSDQPLGRATGDIRLGERLGVQLLFENASNGIGAQSANFGADLRWRLEFR
jgi:translocation and assembly module TamB